MIYTITYIAVIVLSICLAITSFTMVKATTVHGIISFTIFYGIFSGGCMYFFVFWLTC